MIAKENTKVILPIERADLDIIIRALAMYQHNKEYNALHTRLVKMAAEKRNVHGKSNC